MICRYDSPIGLLALTTDGTALTGLRCEPELRSQKVEEPESEKWKVESGKLEETQGLKDSETQRLKVEESISTFNFPACLQALSTAESNIISEKLSTSKVATLVCRWLDLYFSGRKPDFLPPIKLIGTPFQRRVWQALMDIPYGTTTTYGALARRVGCRSAQAVGQAVGHNPVAIIVPCHRVIGSDGSLTGYAYGMERKEYLLRLETTAI